MGDVSRALSGLEDFEVTGAVGCGGGLGVLVRVARPDAACPRCGTFSSPVKECRTQRVRDGLSYERPTVLVWAKRRFRCATPSGVGSFTESTAQVLKSPDNRTSAAPQNAENLYPLEYQGAISPREEYGPVENFGDMDVDQRYVVPIGGLGTATAAALEATTFRGLTIGLGGSADASQESGSVKAHLPPSEMTPLRPSAN